MRKPSSLFLVPSISIISGLIVYLVLSGTVIPDFSPLKNVVEASSTGSFNYVTSTLHYETTEVSFNMEDTYNSTHLYDFSLNGHYGRKEGSLQSETGIYGKSLSWPTGQIVIEGLEIRDMSFSIEAWIYPKSENAISLAGTDTTYPFIQRASNGSMLFQYSGGGASFYSNQTVALNTWTHVALTFDVVSGTAKWYINASEQGSKDIGTRNWDGNWTIGRMNPNYATNEWRGKIDELRIYKGRALSPSEVQKDMDTSIAYKLSITGLTPNEDVAQLSYPDGEFARLNMLEEIADEEGIAEFNVFTFSGHMTPYAAVIEVIHSGVTYTSPLLNFSWGDVYFFSLNEPLNEGLIASLLAGIIIIFPPALFAIYHFMNKRRKGSVAVS